MATNNVKSRPIWPNLPFLGLQGRCFCRQSHSLSPDLGGSKLLRFDKHKAQNRFGANKPFSFLLKNQTRLRKRGDFAHVGVDIGEVIVSWMAILGRKAQTGLQRAA